MKSQVFWCLLFVILFVSFVHSQDLGIDTTPDSYEEIQEITEQIPLDSSGGIDEEKLNESYLFFSSKAEQRILSINMWIEENLGWLQLIFRMIPEISFLFFWNLFYIIYACTHLVLNAKRLWVFIEESFMAYGFGVALFFIFLITNVYLFMASVTTTTLNIFWNTVLPGGLFLAMVLVIVAAVLLFVFWYFFPLIFMRIMAFLQGLLRRKVADTALHKAENRFNDLADKTEKQQKETEAFLRGMRGS